MEECCTGEEAMSRSSKGDDVDGILKIARKNPNVDTEKVLKTRELLRKLRAQGVSPSGYNLIPPFRRQVHVESKYRKTEG